MPTQAPQRNKFPPTLISSRIDSGIPLPIIMVWEAEKH